MPTPLEMTAEEQAALAAEFTDITGLTVAEVADVERQPEPQRTQLIEDWRALGRLSWTKQQSGWDRALAILNLLAAVANPVIAITGGVTGVASMFSAIKAL